MQHKIIDKVTKITRIRVFMKVQIRIVIAKLKFFPANSNIFLINMTLSHFVWTFIQAAIKKRCPTTLNYPDVRLSGFLRDTGNKKYHFVMEFYIEIET